MSRRYSLIEHTADIGIEARADTLPELFVAVGCGLSEVLSESVSETPDETISVSVEGNDPGEMLVNWLNEILFLLESRNLFPLDFLIDSLEEERLRARVHGVSLDSGKVELDREVKSATYHQLQVDQKDDGDWFARVFLDL